MANFSVKGTAHRCFQDFNSALPNESCRDRLLICACLNKSNLQSRSESWCPSLMLQLMRGMRARQIFDEASTSSSYHALLLLCSPLSFAFWPFFGAFCSRVALIDAQSKRCKQQAASSFFLLLFFLTPSCNLASKVSFANSY